MGEARPLQRLNTSARIDAEIERVIELYRELDDPDEVAARLGISVGRVRRRVQQAGVSIRILRVERTVELYRELGSINETAELLGTTVATVRGRLASGVALGLLDAMPKGTPSTGTRRTPSMRSRHNHGNGFRLDPEREAETIRLYEQHRSLRKVGALLGISQEAVRLRLRNAGVQLERHRLLTRAEEEQALALYQELRSVHAVADRMGRAPLTVRSALIRHGVEIDRGAWQHALREPRLQRKVGEARVMKQLYDRLGTERAVAEMLGVSYNHVSRRMRLIGAGPGRGNHGGYRVRRPRDPERVQKVIELYEAGSSARQAAFAVGVQPHTALAWLQRAGFDTSKAAAFARRKAAA